MNKSLAISICLGLITMCSNRTLARQMLNQNSDNKSPSHSVLMSEDPETSALMSLLDSVIYILGSHREQSWSRSAQTNELQRRFPDYEISKKDDGRRISFLLRASESSIRESVSASRKMCFGIGLFSFDPEARTADFRATLSASSTGCRRASFEKLVKRFGPVMEQHPGGPSQVSLHPTGNARPMMWTTQNVIGDKPASTKLSILREIAEDGELIELVVIAKDS